MLTHLFDRAPVRLLCFSILTISFGLHLSPAQDASEAVKKNDAGQADLDEAVILRIDAKSVKELEKVGELLQSALTKGLGDENQAFAKKMYGSVLLQQSQQLVELMGRTRGRTQQLAIKDEALRTLRKAIENDPTLVEGYMLIARLNLLPGGNKDAITEATSKAIELLEDDPTQLSAAYILRALTYEEGEDDKRMADLDAAVKADPENLQAIQARAALRLRQSDVDGAIADLENILSKDPTNQAVAETAVKQLVELNRVEDALDLVSKTLEAKPSEGMYRMRAILYRMQGKDDEALADLNKALAMQPKDPVALLQRAEISLSRDDVKSAKEDLRSAIELAPQVANLDQAIFVRCLIAIEEGRNADAINDMKLLVSRDPGNVLRQIQLANLYIQDERPRKAIETLTTILDRDPSNVTVLRARADAMLAIGEHGKAIKDYERAIKIASDDEEAGDLPGILNNLAWVLATSPDDSIRDGKRAIELSERAVELTDGKEAHILSTLAAGYAEAGDFEKAVEWSSKSVELGKAEEHEQLDQLEKELESYRNQKPWREKQDTKENEVPILSPDDLIDT